MGSEPRFCVLTLHEVERMIVFIKVFPERKHGPMKHTVRIQENNPQEISFYFRSEWRLLLIVTISGLIYNFGLLVGPWFEGQMAQCLVDLAGHRSSFSDMAGLVLCYLAAIATVQGSRFLKRLYVRHFANNISRRMKENLYANLIHKNRAELSVENAGTLLTKAISDADACAEGMRKFTTEIFDTGVALAAYIGMLLHYDFRLALLSLIFPPISYYIAEKMKALVQKTSADSRESAGRLSDATMDRVSGALTYRVFGCEAQRAEDYEKHLADYEKHAVRAGIWVQIMPPIYKLISLISILFILYFGSRNVLGTGWSSWNIAAFTTFLSCYMKLSVKSSHAAKLFNAVQKAQVSWKRIRPLLTSVPEDSPLPRSESGLLQVRNLSFSYPDKNIFTGLSFTAHPGEIIGVTGPVASGKSTLGRCFLCEEPYQGSICFASRELRELPDDMKRSIFGYLGHDPELLGSSILSNILMGEETDPSPYVQMVCLTEDLSGMPEGLETRIGDGGIRLSGGQQKRVALARTLAHPRPVLILDDPFSALDRRTEEEIFKNLQQLVRDQSLIVLLISHRLTLFPKTSQVIWMEDGSATVSTHESLLASSPHYRQLYETQADQISGGAE